MQKVKLQDTQLRRYKKRRKCYLIKDMEYYSKKSTRDYSRRKCKI